MSTIDCNAPSLADFVSSTDFADTAARLTIKVLNSTDVAAMHRVFSDGVGDLGAERAWFASIDCKGDRFEALCMQPACDPAWCRRYLDTELFRSDPWLRYARKHSDPVLASKIAARSPGEETTVQVAREAGFRSCALIPAHADNDSDRFGLLVLGHSEPGFFEAGGFDWLRICAWPLALEMHDWWMGQRLRARMEGVRLSESDLDLLRLHVAGRSSEEIANELQVTRQSINSRFQRLNKRMRVGTRRAAAQVAIDGGLI